MVWCVIARDPFVYQHPAGSSTLAITISSADPATGQATISTWSSRRQRQRTCARGGLVTLNASVVRVPAAPAREQELRGVVASGRALADRGLSRRHTAADPVPAGTVRGRAQEKDRGHRVSHRPGAGRQAAAPGVPVSVGQTTRRRPSPSPGSSPRHRQHRRPLTTASTSSVRQAPHDQAPVANARARCRLRSQRATLVATGHAGSAVQWQKQRCPHAGL